MREQNGQEPADREPGEKRPAHRRTALIGLLLLAGLSSVLSAVTGKDLTAHVTLIVGVLLAYYFPRAN